jgi:hypothetical protein
MARPGCGYGYAIQLNPIKIKNQKCRGRTAPSATPDRHILPVCSDSVCLFHDTNRVSGSSKSALPEAAKPDCSLCMCRVCFCPLGRLNWTNHELGHLGSRVHGNERCLPRNGVVIPQSNSELTSMAKLTWWKHDAKSQLYENVISKRRIPEAEWKKLDTRFVHLDEKSGSSFTRDFLPVSLRAPTLPPTSTSGGIGSLPQKMGNLNLGGPASSRAPARPSARSSRPSAEPSQPSAPPANKPAGRTTRNSTKAGALPTAPAGPPGPSGAPASLPEPYCVINGRSYPAHYNRERNWEVTLNRQTFLIERDMQQRIHFVNHNGNILKVTKMPLPSG